MEFDDVNTKKKETGVNIALLLLKEKKLTRNDEILKKSVNY